MARSGAGTPEPAWAQQPNQARRSVGIEPWAMLLEQLAEAPEGNTPTREDGKQEWGRALSGRAAFVASVPSRGSPAAHRNKPRRRLFIRPVRRNQRDR